MLKQIKLYGILFLSIISSYSYGQGSLTIKDTLQQEGAYIHSIVQSKKGTYYGYGVGSFAVCVLDNKLQKKFEFKLNGLWGGGGIDFSADEKYLAYFSYGDVDTLQIYNIQKKEKKAILSDRIKGIKFINKKNDILFFYENNLSIYSVKEEKVIKTIVLETPIDEVQIDPNLKKGYVLDRTGVIRVLNLKTLSIEDSLLKLDYPSNQLLISDLYIAYGSSEGLSIYDRKQKKYILQASPNLGYITEIYLGKKQFYVTGRTAKMLIYDPVSNLQKILDIPVSDIGSFSVFELKNAEILLGDDANLYLLKDAM